MKLALATGLNRAAGSFATVLVSVLVALPTRFSPAEMARFFSRTCSS